MSIKPRVRFAPSPTGPLHIGGVRTALYNYLFARNTGGTFILRIEDTDQKRFVPGAEEYIIESLKWCGLELDEGPEQGGAVGPYRQSERKGTYRQHAEALIKSGHAYYAFDTSAELDEMRDKAKQAGLPNWQYNSITRVNMRNSLTMPADEAEQRIANNEAYVVRVKMPRNEEVRFKDRIRDWVVVNTDNLDDKVLFKSDGMPTYHLANIADDKAMGITHVIRGEEWLPSAPLHVLLYKYLGWEDSMPEFAHLPLILKPNGNGKLSKRDGDKLGFPVFPLEWKDPETGEVSSGYREKGYFPEGFINMLAFLGWNPGTTQEVFTKQELIEQFDLDRVGRSGAKFDPDKTRWFNQQHLRSKSNEELARLIRPLVDEQEIEMNTERLEAYCGIMKERASFIPDLMEGSYIFQAPDEFDERMIRKKWKENTPEILEGFADKLKTLEPFNAAEIESCMKTYLEEKGIGMGALLANYRMVITGQGMGPSMMDISELLGKEEVLSRIDNGITKISKWVLSK